MGFSGSSHSSNIVTEGHAPSPATNLQLHTESSATNSCTTSPACAERIPRPKSSGSPHTTGSASIWPPHYKCSTWSECSMARLCVLGWPCFQVRGDARSRSSFIYERQLYNGEISSEQYVVKFNIECKTSKCGPATGEKETNTCTFKTKGYGTKQSWPCHYVFQIQAP